MSVGGEIQEEQTGRHSNRILGGRKNGKNQERGTGKKTGELLAKSA